MNDGAFGHPFFVSGSPVAAKHRAALYHRVSTPDQNPALARAELRAAAKRLGYRVVLDVEETGSGAQNDRPGLRRILEAARRHEFDALLVCKLDRAGRSALDLLANIQQLVDLHGVRFMVTSQGLDLKPGGDAISRLLMTVLAAVAEFERDLIRDRTPLGLAAARRRGVRLCRRALPGPAPAAVLKRRAAGRSWTQVAGSSPFSCVNRTRGEAPRSLHAALASVASFDFSRDMSK